MSFLVLFTLFRSLSFAADFDGHTDFTHVELEGRISVSCFVNGQYEHKVHFCRGYILEPTGNWAYFHHPAPAETTRIVIWNYTKDGLSKRRTFDWNAVENHTNKRVNLWTKTLFQEPLLGEGENKIEFSFYKDQSFLSGGNVKVQVLVGEARTCQPETLTGAQSSMCRDSSLACQTYFNNQNNCLTP